MDRFTNNQNLGLKQHFYSRVLIHDKGVLILFFLEVQLIVAGYFFNHRCRDCIPTYGGRETKAIVDPWQISGIFQTFEALFAREKLSQLYTLRNPTAPKFLKLLYQWGN